MQQNNNHLVITSYDEVLDILLCPEKTPIAYMCKLKELIDIAGMTENEAKKHLLQPIQLNIFYDYGLGLFAVESSAIGFTEIYNPYTGEEISLQEDI